MGMCGRAHPITTPSSLQVEARAISEAEQRARVADIGTPRFAGHLRNSRKLVSRSPHMALKLSERPSAFG